VISINGVECKRRFAVLQKRQNIVGNLLKGGCLSEAPMEKDKEAVASRGLFKVPGNPTALFKKVKSQRSLKKELQESTTTTTTTINEAPQPEEEPKKKRKKRFLFKGLLKGSGMSREERKALKKRKKEGDAQGEDSGSLEDSAGAEGEEEEESTTRVPRAPPTPQKG